MTAVEMSPKLVGSDPPPRHMPLFGLGKALRKHPFPTIPPQAYQTPVLKVPTPGGQRFYVVSDPAGVKRILLDHVANYPKTERERRFFSAMFGDGLLSTDGEMWRVHRRTMAPSFSPPSVAAYAPAMAACAEAFRRRWDQAPEGAEIDVAEAMTDLTLQIIARTMFSTDGADVADVVRGTMEKAMEQLDFNILDILPVIGEHRFKARERRIEAIFAEMDGAIARMIAERQADPEGGPKDLLSRLIAARDGETGEGMSPKEIRDQVVTIFLAGHETTAATMCWLWYLLSQHPQVDARLHAELDQVLGGRTPGHEDLAQLPYARMVVDEALRIYPAAPGLSTRMALEADEICGVKIPKGAMIAVAPWIQHRHEALWEDPGRFDPERFAPGAERPRFAYMPFGGGPKVCIGAQLAVTETLLILATLAQGYSLALRPGHEVEILQKITMRPRGGLPMILHRR
ncbi:MAG: cytochrome P450 [Pseudomonadota bacterium]